MPILVMNTLKDSEGRWYPPGREFIGKNSSIKTQGLEIIDHLAMMSQTTREVPKFYFIFIEPPKE